MMLMMMMMMLMMMHDNYDGGDDDDDDVENSTDSLQIAANGIINTSCVGYGLLNVESNRFRVEA